MGGGGKKTLKPSKTFLPFAKLASYTGRPAPAAPAINCGRVPHTDTRRKTGPKRAPGEVNSPGFPPRKGSKFPSALFRQEEEEELLLLLLLARPPLPRSAFGGGCSRLRFFRSLDRSSFPACCSSGGRGERKNSRRHCFRTALQAEREAGATARAPSSGLRSSARAMSPKRAERRWQAGKLLPPAPREARFLKWLPSDVGKRAGWLNLLRSGAVSRRQRSPTMDRRSKASSAIWAPPHPPPTP